MAWKFTHACMFIVHMVASNIRTMNSVPIATKTPAQHYPAFSLPTHTDESLHAAYAAQASVSQRSVSVIGANTSRNYNSDYMCSTAATDAPSNDNPYKFMVQPESARTLKSLCSTSHNLPTLLKASLEASLREMSTSGKGSFISIKIDPTFKCRISILF